MDFTARLKPLLQTKGVSWKQLSDELKIGRNQALYWQKNGTLPDGKTLIKLADFFDVSVDYLVGCSDEPTRGAVRSTPDERLLDAFHQLNAEGKDLVLDYVERLTEKPRYTTETAIKVYHAPTAKVPRRIRMTAQQRHLQSAVNRAEVVVGKKK